MRAKKAYAIVIGSGLLKGKHPRCTADLKSADKDAQAMAAFAEKRGFVLVGPDGTQAPFLSEQAKKNDIMGAVTNVATELEDGDILLFFYSGHGATLPVAEGSSFQQQRETWSLLDGRLWDLEWDHLMGEFKSGVRLVLVSDSCYSGGFGPPEAMDPRETKASDCSITKVLRGDCFKDYATDSVKEFARLKAALGEKPPLRARALLLAACQANQLACAEPEYGHFTHALLEVVDIPNLSYKAFYRQVRRKFAGRSTQSPFWWLAGPGSHAFPDEDAFQP